VGEPGVLNDVMMRVVATLLLVAWMPGAVMFRLPVLNRAGRAALPAEERFFWQVLLSLTISLSIVLVLAAAHRYSFSRLLIANLVLISGLALGSRFQLRLGGARPTWSALIVVAIIAMGCWRFFPSAEYVIGGKDPGTYVNEGVQMAQRGTMIYRDPLVASIPAEIRPLFLPSLKEADHYGTRFMGFPVLDPVTGRVVGQFPHLFPASIAIGYGVYGLSGARLVVGVWAILGLVAVYLAGARLLGRNAAAAGVALLALHVIEAWFARYPNAEVVMQTLLFAALLANARAHVDGDRFFAPVSAALLVLLLFLRIDAVLAVAALVSANLLAFVRGRGPHWSFGTVLGAGGALALAYYTGPMRAYAYLPIQFILNLQTPQRLGIAAAGAGLLALVYLGRRRPPIGAAVTNALPLATSALLCGLAVYALFFREPAGRLALENAYALRMYAAFYTTVPAVFAGLIGYTLTARRSFWRDPAFFITVAAFSVFFFYKIRIVPEHFWAARRFLPVILPGTLLLACAAATWGWRQTGWRRLASGAIGAVFLVLLGMHYTRAAAPILDHVEYAGIIPQLEHLAARIGDDDLLLVESRDAGSDAHVLALPLAYIYARDVLVLGSVRPEREVFSSFLEWARQRHRHVYFLGGGGTELLSRQWTATAISSQRFQVPEYESALNAYPRGIRRKEFDFGLYELRSGDSGVPPTFDLDVGDRDDLNVVRFHAKEAFEGHTFRWSQRQSFVSVPALPAASRELVLEMSSGGRPAASDPAEVTVHLNDRLLGTLHVTDGFKSYMLEIPGDVVAAARTGQPARLRFVVPVWNPQETLGSPDDRDLGVMIDRVQIR
jgi:hypothetical protein